MRTKRYPTTERLVNVSLVLHEKTLLGSLMMLNISFVLLRLYKPTHWAVLRLILILLTSDLPGFRHLIRKCVIMTFMFNTATLT